MRSASIGWFWSATACGWRQALLEDASRSAAPGRLAVAMRDEAGSMVLVVEDEGPGLAPDFAAHGFDAFARAEASRSRRSGGSGLGLSVVRAIAAAHDGRARDQLSARGGSMFEIVLPLAKPWVMAQGREVLSKSEAVDVASGYDCLTFAF